MKCLGMVCLVTSVAASFLSTQPLMRQMWSTPILSVNLLESDHIFTPEMYRQEFLSPQQQIVQKAQKSIILKTSKTLNETSKLIRHLFDDFNANLATEYKHSRNMPAGVTDSDAFFFYQKDLFEHFDNHSKDSLPSDAKFNQLIQQYSKIQAMVMPHVKSFISECSTYSLDEDKIEYGSFAARNNSFYFWSSLHSEGSSHSAHHHVNSAISGVLYLDVPPTSGDLVFEDPRGAHPPFGKTMHVQSSRGSLVLFPGWLVHRVEPTKGPVHRISLSFNIAGDWESTSDINRGSYVEE